VGLGTYAARTPVSFFNPNLDETEVDERMSEPPRPARYVRPDQENKPDQNERDAETVVDENGDHDPDHDQQKWKRHVDRLPLAEARKLGRRFAWPNTSMDS
jgi:hypothetical protein